ncbi:MAG: hypothetical protein V2I33_22450 [Kangiellaceae bacterium]|jgi:hypothetical protein|nr:hypothetical protein [Kangiellaceae bacterium]
MGLLQLTALFLLLALPQQTYGLQGFEHIEAAHQVNNPEDLDALVADPDYLVLVVFYLRNHSPSKILSAQF